MFTLADLVTRLTLEDFQPIQKNCGRYYWHLARLSWYFRQANCPTVIVELAVIERNRVDLRIPGEMVSRYVTTIGLELFRTINHRRWYQTIVDPLRLIGPPDAGTYAIFADDLSQDVLYGIYKLVQRAKTQAAVYQQQGWL